MIFLPDKNILFLKAKKVAGTSFEIALSQFAGKHAIITPISESDESTRKEKGFRGAQNYRDQSSENSLKKRVSVLFDKEATTKNSNRKKYYNHMSAKEVRDNLGKNVFDGAFKISIARNPFDKLVSQYFFSTRMDSEPPDFITWVRQNPSALNDNDAQYFIGRESVVDFFIRYEHIGDDLRTLEECRPDLQGVAETMLSVRAKGGIRPQGTRAVDMFAGHDDLISCVRFFNEYLITKFEYDLNS